MTEQCGWQDKRGNDCARPAVWIVVDPHFESTYNVNQDDEVVYCCNVHLGDVVKERAVEWVGCWVDRA
jgi:hypothetical protein